LNPSPIPRDPPPSAGILRHHIFRTTEWALSYHRYQGVDIDTCNSISTACLGVHTSSTCWLRVFDAFVWCKVACDAIITRSLQGLLLYNMSKTNRVNHQIYYSLSYYYHHYHYYYYYYTFDKDVGFAVCRGSARGPYSVMTIITITMTLASNRRRFLSSRAYRRCSRPNSALSGIRKFRAFLCHPTGTGKQKQKWRFHVFHLYIICMPSVY
jgi:hypothetical protein